MKNWAKRTRREILRHAGMALTGGIVLLIAAGVYGIGLLGMLGDGSDTFYASGTPSEQVNTRLNEIFGTGSSDTSVILFEANDRSADVRSTTHTSEATALLAKLDSATVTSYMSTGSDQFVSRDGHDMYAIVTLGGAAEEQYAALTEFANSVESDKFTVSLGGTLVGQQQTLEQVKIDLSIAEMVSLPILAILLFWFFRGPVAAGIPLGMSLLTIAGALAVARLVHIFVAIDTYTLNVITILGVGLSIDYSLLMVNRFREELHNGITPEKAAKTTMRTAGRTVLFSGLTVIACLLSLLLFPVGFMHSVSIGGTAAVLVAMFISTLLLPPALQLLGLNINKWSMKPRTKAAHGWRQIAITVTRRPYLALAVGTIVITGLIWPVTQFETKTFDWHVLPNNQSAYHVGRVMSERFDVETPTLTVLAEFNNEPTISQLCNLAKTVAAVEGVDSIQTAYAPSENLSDCDTMPYILEQLAMSAPETVQKLEAMSAAYVSGRYARVEIVPSYEASDSRIRGVIDVLKTTDYGTDVTISVAGTAARSQDTSDVYRQWAPYVVGVIALAMIVVLSLLLGSVLLPLQAILINSLALFISLGVLIMIFQFGWGAGLFGMTTTGGFELSIPILIFVMAFGLSMDYSVFLYSRIHEVYDLTNDSHEAIVGGVARTGPIITSAALLMFVVVAAFATSHIALIQQIGVGLAVAVLVDAFFIRIILVPAVMKLFGRMSWWGPAWLKKLTIRHE